MRLLLDTHLLLWAVGRSGRLSPTARDLMIDPSNTLLVSVASFWEIAVKNGRGRPEFRVDLERLRSGLKQVGYLELAISSDHAVAVQSLPDLHRDPFDRIMIAQAMAEGLTFLTADRAVLAYGAPARGV